MGIAAILMAIEMLLTGLNTGSCERDDSHGRGQKRCFGRADPDGRCLAAG